MTRSAARQKVMTILYQIIIRKDNKLSFNPQEIIEENIEQKEEFIINLVNGVLNNEEELENLANKYLKDWKINRLDKLGSIILKMALYEMQYTDTPHIVIIDEAINLAKEYCDEELAKMINATLDSYYKDIEKRS